MEAGCEVPVGENPVAHICHVVLATSSNEE